MTISKTVEDYEVIWKVFMEENKKYIDWCNRIHKKGAIRGE